MAPPPTEGLAATDVESMLRGMHPGWTESGIAGVLANFEMRADGTVAPWLTLDRHMMVLHGLWEHRPSTRYAQVAVPTLLAPADDSTPWTAGKRDEVERAAATIPVSRTRWFRSHHDIHAEQPHALADSLHDAVVDGFFA